MKTHNIEIIKKWEGLRLRAYLPTPNDVWTIGYGHTKGVKEGMIITVEEAENLLRQDLIENENTINRLVKVGLTQDQFDALVSLVHNIGPTAFRKSTLLRKLNSGDYEGAANEFPKWKYQKGKVLRGLVNRRADEMALFQGAHDSSVVAPQTVDEPEGLKPLWKSKEVIGGFTTALSGVAAMVPGLNDTAQILLIGAVITLGFGFVINRFLANRKGQR